MASSTSSYIFTDNEFTQLARCTDQAEFLYLIKRILQSKSINLSPVFDAQTTLGTSTDYGASVLTRFFGAQSHALHLEVGYALFKPLSSSSCLKKIATLAEVFPIALKYKTKLGLILLVPPRQSALKIQMGLPKPFFAKSLLSSA